MTTREEAEFELLQKKKVLTEKVNSFIRRYKAYFGVTPKKSDLDISFSNDPDYHLAEMMFKTGKNPFLTKHPERDALLVMAKAIHLSWYEEYTNKVYDIDDSLISICGVSITE